MFIVENHLGDLELEKKETDGLRLYKLPSNEWVPSITSVTSCLLYTSPSPRDRTRSRMPSSA